MRVPPMTGLLTRLSNLMGTSEGAEPDLEAVVTDLERANIITSEVAGSPGRHKVVLDVDMPVHIEPSSTEGHFHLFIDKELTWDEYSRLLWVMADVGLLEEGYVSASDARRYTAVRLPWVKKNPRECQCGDCRAARGMTQVVEPARVFDPGHPVVRYDYNGLPVPVRSW